MKKFRTLIDTFTGKMFLVGPGGYEIHLSPGSEVHELEESSAGHLMLPCSRFGRQQAQKTEESQVFTVGEFFIAKSEPEPQEVSPSYSGTARTAEPEKPRTDADLNFMSSIEEIIEEARNGRMFVLVDDEEMRQAARWLWFEMGIAAELSGAAALAALRAGRISLDPVESVGLVICGAGRDGLD